MHWWDFEGLEKDWWGVCGGGGGGLLALENTGKPVNVSR